MKELDLRLEPGAMQRAQEICGEHEGALQDRDHEQILRLDRRDRLGERFGALGDRRFVEKHFDASVAAHGSTSTENAWVLR